MDRPVPGAVELVPAPGSGRRYEPSPRPVRLGDVSPKGRMRLDAVARFIQDVADDDARDADLGGRTAWVLRRTRIRVEHPPVYRERLTLTTWCSGIGARWAERRTTLAGDRGGAVETVAVWVHVDLDSGAPARLGAGFTAVYGAAAADRRVRALLLHGEPVDGATTRPWSTRFSDFDVMGHVNNAVYWTAVEDEAAGRGWAGRLDAEVEFRSGVDRGDQVELATVEVTPEGPVQMWWLVDGTPRASASVAPTVT
jgi:acyl-ACP thioesterase